MKTCILDMSSLFYVLLNPTDLFAQDISRDLLAEPSGTQGMEGFGTRPLRVPHPQSP